MRKGTGNIVACPQQQWLCKSVTMPPYRCTACLVVFSFYTDCCPLVRAPWICVNNCPTRCDWLYTVYYISVNCSTCFGWWFHPSSGAHITAITAPDSSNCSTTAEDSRDGLTSARCCNYSYMCSWLWVECSFNCSTTAEDSRDGLTGTRCCNYSYMCSWLWVECSLNCSTTAGGSRDGLTSARCCNYSYMCSWWWVELPPETCRAVYRNIINCI
jgi:hypothetical protein